MLHDRRNTSFSTNTRKMLFLYKISYYLYTMLSLSQMLEVGWEEKAYYGENVTRTHWIVVIVVSKQCMEALLPKKPSSSLVTKPLPHIKFT
jgi:hypothetical protein